MSSLLNQIISIPIRFPKTVVGLTLLITLGSVYLLGNPGLKMDSTPYPLNQDHPSMVAFNQLKEDFTGTLETGLVHLRHPESIFNAKTFQRITDLTNAFEQVTIITPADADRLRNLIPAMDSDQAEITRAILEGGITRDDNQRLLELTQSLELNGNLSSPLGVLLEEISVKLYPIKKVTSLANVEYLEARGDELVVGKVYEKIPASEAEWKKVRERVQDNDVLTGMVVSEDRKSTIIQAEVQIHYTRSDLVYQLGVALREALARFPGDEETHMAGFPIMTATFQKAMQDDNQKFFPVVILLVLLALFMTFRSFSGVLLPMGVVIISILWTLAIMVLLNVPLNMMTTALPVFLIAIGVADGVHVLSEFQDQFRKLGNRLEAIRATMEHMALPVIMTSITTGVGFISLSFTRVTMIQKFGIFVSIGVMAAMVFSLAFLPAVLTFGRKAPKERKQRKAMAWVQAMDQKILEALRAISDFAIRQHRIIVGVGIVLIVVVGYGMKNLRVENDFLTYFPDEKPIVVASRSMDKHMAGSNVINILVKGPKNIKEPFKQPEFLLALEKLRLFLEKQEIVGKAFSLSDVVKRIHKVMNNNLPAYDRIPHTREKIMERGRQIEVDGKNLIAQYLLLYENGGGENLTNNVDSTFSYSNMAAILNSQNSVKISQLMEATKDYARANFPAGMSMNFAGGAEMAVATNKEIVNTQITSLVLSVVVVFVLLLIQFRSLEKGLLAIIPLGATVIFNFGMMGWMGIMLNVAVAIVSSIVIGIGVDFAIHYLTRLQAEADRKTDYSNAFGETMLASGKAITANALVVATGFLALILSVLMPLQTMGVLIAQTLVLSMISTLVLMPAVATFFRPRFLRNSIQSAAGERLATEGEISG